MAILEAFEQYCRKHNITSEQYKHDIFPAYAAGYVEGQKHMRKEDKHPTYQTNKRGNPV